jgi:hypothetical protein
MATGSLRRRAACRAPVSHHLRTVYGSDAIHICHVQLTSLCGTFSARTLWGSCRGVFATELPGRRVQQRSRVPVAVLGELSAGTSHASRVSSRAVSSASHFFCSSNALPNEAHGTWRLVTE